MTHRKIRTALFLFTHLFAICLLLSFFLWPSGQSFWKIVDESLFRWLNTALLNHPLQRLFWALANVKLTDIYGALFLLSSFLLYISEGTSRDARKVRCGYLLYTLIWFEITILCTKQLLTPLCEHFDIARYGPTAVLSNTFRLSTLCPWLKIKDLSYFCFPSDHAMIVLQWDLLFAFFAGLRRGLFVFFCSLFFLLPRLISGAHWISDILVGSVAVVSVTFAWATISPLYPYLMNFIQSKLLRVSNWQALDPPTSFALGPHGKE